MYCLHNKVVTGQARAPGLARGPHDGSIRREFAVAGKALIPVEKRKSRLEIPDGGREDKVKRQ